MEAVRAMIVLTFLLPDAFHPAVFKNGTAHAEHVQKTGVINLRRFITAWGLGTWSVAPCSGRRAITAH
jgi:hypothetical protein